MSSSLTSVTDLNKIREISDSLMVVPQEESKRCQIQNAIKTKWNPSVLEKKNFFLTRQQLEDIATELLVSLELSLTFTGWTMVQLANLYWKDEVQKIPFSRRILLLPHCMRNKERCQGKYDEKGLICYECGSCHLFSLQKRARKLGYQVLIAEGTPIVMQSILSGEADAILGVGCLKSLERAFDKLIWAGVPALAIPLFEGTCSNTKTDLTAVIEMIETPFLPSNEPFRNGSWMPLLRITADLFKKERLEQLLGDSFLFKTLSQPLQQKSDSSLFNQTESASDNITSGIKKDQIVAKSTNIFISPHSTLNPNSSARLSNDDQQKDETEINEPRQASENILSINASPKKSSKITWLEQVSQDFLSRGGKFYRPFITIAAFDLMKNGLLRPFSSWNGTADSIPDFVQKTAVAMELFHKASLVHDDIEDDDPYRYGLATLHREIGIASALNVGDHLLGLGYHLIASLQNVDSATIADLIVKMSQTHLLLCNGQGLELDWIAKNQRNHQPLTPREAIRIYALKTSPAFEASLFAGLRLAVSRDQMNQWEPILSQFSRYLGIGFQIRNDLNDWTLHSHNKKIIGEDFFRGRPTLLWAFAHETLNESMRQSLRELAKSAASLQQLGNSEKNSIKNNRWSNLDSEDFEQKEMERQKILDSVRAFYEEANVFEKANHLIQLYSQRSEKVLELLNNEPISIFLRSFIETILR